MIISVLQTAYLIECSMARTRQFRFPSYGLFGEMLKTSANVSQLFFSSHEVISYRSHMLALAMCGQIPFTHAEFTRLWQEKCAANMEAGATLFNNRTVNWAGCNPLDVLTAQWKAFNAFTLPYHRKASSNAKRLRKRKSRS